MCVFRGWRGCWQDNMDGVMGGGRSQRRSRGDHAFAEYRGEKLHRLENEQKEFYEFLARLHLAKDKAEFDQFMSSGSARPVTPSMGAGPQDPIQDAQG